MRQRVQWLVRDTTFRALLVGSAAAVTAVWKTDDPTYPGQASQRRGRVCRSRSEQRPDSQLPKTTTTMFHGFLFPQVSLAEAASKNFAGGVDEDSFRAPSSLRRRRDHTARAAASVDRKSVYDFIVIGYGNAGRSAVETLQKQCPSATIALLDPLRWPSVDREGVGSNQVFVDYYAARAIGLQPNEQSVEVDDDDDDDDDSSCIISYRHAVLVATGSRGAPPPSYLMDEKARPHIFELRSTIQQLPVVVDDVSSTDDPTQQQQNERPILSPEHVRRHVVQRAKAGDDVAVLGCGWDAVDLVVDASSYRWKTQKATIIFGSHGPISHVLPNYLSTAVSKRLRVKRVTVLDRSLVRYISYDDRKKHLQVYTAKSFDFLDGQTSSVDLVVIAPEVQGPRGTGTLPTDEVPDFLEAKVGRSSWYQTWAGLSVHSPDDPAFVVCYKDDGRIAVNTELCACRGVYAAGSSAKCANGLTGHAMVAGAGVEDGREAGHVAATNMARQYNASTTTTTAKGIFGFGSSDGRSVTTLVKDSLPVWRSDLRSTAGSAQDQVSSLADIGIIALCVGNCDSESMSTHGVWWTNQSAQRRLMGLMNDDADDLGSIQTKQQERKRFKQVRKPVYGLGVVYYLDRTGKTQGVMTWGLPFHRNHNLNQRLVEQMKNVIKTNGGFRSLETDLDRIKMTEYLGEASKTMVATAFGGQPGDSGQAHYLDRALDNFPRPLHRFTEVRPPQARSVGVLKRKDGHGQGILGEDLFARYEQDDMPDAPVPKPQFLGNIESAIAKVEARYVWDVWEQSQRRWDENESRARPPKEELLWIRKGDEIRNTPQREVIAAAYSNALNTKRYGT